MRPESWSRRASVLGCALALLVGLVAALAAAQWQHQANQAQVREQLQASSERAAEAVSRRLHAVEDSLLALRDAVLDAEDPVQGLARAQFQRHAARLGSGSRLPGMLDVSFVRCVPAAQETTIAASMRCEGAVDVELHPLGAQVGERLALQYTEPLQGNALLAGKQGPSDPAWREAAHAALRSGVAQLTPPAAAGAGGAQAIALLVPVYSTATPPEPAQRQSQAHGWISATLLPQQLLREIDEADGSLALALTDAAAVRRVYASPRWQDSALAPVHHQVLELQGRLWYVDVQGLPFLADRLGLREPVAVAAAVFLVVSLLGLALLAGWRALRHRRTLPGQPARMVSVMGSGHDAIVVHDLQGRILEWSAGAERILGWRAAEAIGRDLMALCVAPEQWDEVLAAIERVRAGESVPPLRTFRQDMQGRAVEVMLSMSPVLADEARRVTGAVTTMREVLPQRAVPDPTGLPGAALELPLRQRLSEMERVAIREQAILASVDCAVVAADLQGRIVLFNPAAEATFARPAAKALGHPVFPLLDPEELHERAQDLPADMVRALMPHASVPPPAAEGEPHGEWRFVRADGTRFSGRLRVRVLHGHAGEASGFLLVITDLTEHKAMQEALRVSTGQAQAASRAKSAFLSTMSHEFRTPLNAVVGFSHLLQTMALPDKAQAFANHIAQAADRLLKLTNDVLDFSNIAAGDVELQRAPFELRALLEAVLETVRPGACAKGLSLDLACSPELPATLCGDAQRLEQLLLELLGNAVKFTHAGGVKLRVYPTGREPGRVHLRIDVVDTGIGIEPEAQARIFEPFTQGNSTATRRFAGTGLSLSIVQRLVVMMGGHIELTSVPGQGSTFSVSLVLDTAGRAD